MLKPLRLAAGLAILTALLATIALVGGRDGVVSARLAPPRDHIVNRIAFVGLDGRIRSIRPNGSGVREISPKDGLYTWPTWSPDARRLVFSGIVGGSSGTPEINLYSFTRYSGRVQNIYSGEPGVAGLLAEGVLHYPLWSPDSQTVAFIAITRQGLTLLLDDLSDDPGADLVLGQGPLWISWSHDSRYLLIHRGASQFLLDTSGGHQPELLDFQTARYRVPAWKPREDTVTLMTETAPDRYALYTVDVTSTGPDAVRQLTEVESDPAFMWSPRGDFLAVAGSPRGLELMGSIMLVYQELRLVPEGDKTMPMIIDDNILAFFWAPNGSKLAYVTLSQVRGVLTWNLLDLNSRSQRRLIDFVPSRNQMTMFQFFDQYAYSHSLWSPDSRSLVFAGRPSTEATEASFGADPGHEDPHIMVLDTERSRSVEYIADGVLGFWSPR